jgi:hypothetical protein
MASFCEHNNEPSDSIKAGRLFFDKVHNYQLFKEYPAPRRRRRRSSSSGRGSVRSFIRSSVGWFVCFGFKFDYRLYLWVSMSIMTSGWLYSYSMAQFIVVWKMTTSARYTF